MENNLDDFIKYMHTTGKLDSDLYDEEDSDEEDEDIDN